MGYRRRGSICNSAFLHRQALRTNSQHSRTGYGGVCILLFGVIAASGLRVLVESKVDYSKSSNLVMTAVIMIIGLSGAKLTFGTISVQGMVLATLVAILLSVTFKILDRLGFLNHI